MMRDTEKYVECRTLYAKTGNLKQVERILAARGEDHAVPYNTLYRAYCEKKNDWENARETYLKEIAGIKVQASDIVENLFMDLKDILARLKPQIEESLKSGKIQTQAIFGLDKMVNRLVGLAEILKNEGKRKEFNYDTFFDVFIEHPIVGPKVLEHKDELTEMIIARLKKLEKNRKG
jgi:hypothetical protein